MEWPNICENALFYIFDIEVEVSMLEVEKYNVLQKISYITCPTTWRKNLLFISIISFFSR